FVFLPANFYCFYVDLINCEEQQDEAISNSFICCVCLDLLYKPIVLECGHVSCFWCVHISMDPGHTSHCPICRNSYHYFPTICEVLHFLLVKMYPIAYRRREKQMLEEEKARGCFSPQLRRDVNSIGGSKSCQGEGRLSVMPSAPCIIKEDHSQLCIPTPAAIKDYNLSANLPNSTSVSSADLLCPACKRLLFRPAVLNCGHVLCKGCIVVPEDGIIICRVCEIPHPTDCPNICLELNNFLEERFPDEYTERKGNVEEMKSPFQHNNSSFCCDAETSSKKKFRICKGEEDLLPWWKEYGSKVHHGAGCDYCGMYPIVGDRYRCQDCVEKMGFDLCGDCYKTSSKRPGRFNQQHTSDHRFELMKPLELSASITFQLVGEHIVDSSGTPVVAISALEDSSDGWIAVDSADFQHNIDDNSPHGNRATDTLNDILGESALVEFSDDALETSGYYVDSVAHHDSDIEDQAEDAPSTA
ncbi:E3 ubiquitin-protein ligase PRT1-like, partial [Silene latifolia]|uniref:E3 ubiquitin-protein ligase PRT1-like n=1 Tax=Silene latifolia TaxID=37657 RepID=UPI003D7759DE